MQNERPDIFPQEREFLKMTEYPASARSKSKWLGVGVAVVLMLAAVPAAAADCGSDAGGFEAWLARFRRTAAAQGISPDTISSALAGVSYDPTVIRTARNDPSSLVSRSSMPGVWTRVSSAAARA
jgi:membrane-bound lytic murein transglycosylase B